MVVGFNSPSLTEIRREKWVRIPAAPLHGGGSLTPMVGVVWQLGSSEKSELSLKFETQERPVGPSRTYLPTLQTQKTAHATRGVAVAWAVERGGGRSRHVSRGANARWGLSALRFERAPDYITSATRNAAPNKTIAANIHRRALI